MDRRSFISNLSIFTSGLALASTSFGRHIARVERSGSIDDLRVIGYGDLRPTPALNTGETFLALPRGFQYNIIGRKDSAMSDGRKTPPLHDGMHAFKVGRELRLVRNHEVVNGSVPRPGSALDSRVHYDATAGGGTTTLIIDPKTRTIVRDFVSLSGTLVNCAGGPTPWGSWITCEETTLGQALRKNSRGVEIGGFPKPHGYAFEVSAAANGPVLAVPLKAMGRFVHEAAAVDRKTGIAYLTEDHVNSGFYRFIPTKKRRLDNGILQMLALKGKPQYDTRTGQKVGAPLAVTWVTIENPDPPEADVDTNVVHKEGRSKGGAVFSRLEGCCACEDGSIYFTATSGGDSKGGQIWKYEPLGKDEGRLTLAFESPSRDILDMPDNICVRPKTDLLFVCEDSDYVGAGGTPENYLRIMTPQGRMADLARNITPKMERGEFAGVTFSPDGETLFFNIQQIGATFAVWGDWSAFKR